MMEENGIEEPWKEHTAAMKDGKKKMQHKT